MAPITSGASTRSGGRKRRKKSHHNCGFIPGYGIKWRFRGNSQVQIPGTDWVTRLIVSRIQKSSFVNHPVSRSISVCSCCYDGSATLLGNCDTTNQTATHSPATCHNSAAVLGRTVNKQTNITRITHSRFRCNREFLSILALLLTSQALLTTTTTTFTAHAAAVPSPSYLASTSSRANTRYKLLPASQNTDSIFIYFNPPSILNLKVNTRKSVSFNFTLYRRPPRTDIPSNKTTTDFGNLSIQTTEFLDAPQNDDTFGASMTTITNSTGSSYNHHIPLLTSPLPSSAISNSTSLPLKKHSQDKKGRTTEQDHDKDLIYWVMIYSDDDSIARPVVASPNGMAAAHADAKGSYILMAVWAGRQHNFSVEARHIGRVTMSVAVVHDDGDRSMPQASYVQAVAASQYPVTAVRGERTADLVFNISAAAIAIIISFGVGAVTDTDSLKRQMKYPVALIIGFCCQFIIMPVMAFALAMMLPLDKEILFGLLCVACVPGGGISHVAVIIADGDAALSLTMNLINVVAMLGTAPLWIFVLGQYFQSDPQAVLNPRMIPIYNFEIWFASIFFAYAAGLIIKRLRPTIADAILMWLIKPFLLLASILYITLGVYINMYVFELINGYALLGAMILPFSGCVLGGVLAAICRQNYAFVKTIALETSSLNCLVVMVALRFSLKQPDADLAAVIPIWVMFTIPGFFVFLAICNKVKNILLHFWRNRNNKDTDVMSSSKAYSISSSVASPPGTTTLSAPLVTTDTVEDDATISTLSNQKVTVL